MNYTITAWKYCITTNYLYDRESKEKKNKGIRDELFVDSNVDPLLDEVKRMNRDDVSDRMEAPLPTGDLNEEFEITLDSNDSHVLLGGVN